jgi:hypothetical protein
LGEAAYGWSIPRSRVGRGDRDAALQQEGADLIDDAGALTDQSLAHPVQRLQVELVGALGGDEIAVSLRTVERAVKPYRQETRQRSLDRQWRECAATQAHPVSARTHLAVALGREARPGIPPLIVARVLDGWAAIA